MAPRYAQGSQLYDQILTLETETPDKTTTQTLDRLNQFNLPKRYEVARGLGGPTLKPGQYYKDFKV